MNTICCVAQHYSVILSFPWDPQRIPWVPRWSSMGMIHNHVMLNGNQLILEFPYTQGYLSLFVGVLQLHSLLWGKHLPHLKRDIWVLPWSGVSQTWSGCDLKYLIYGVVVDYIRRKTSHGIREAGPSMGRGLTSDGRASDYSEGCWIDPGRPQ